MQTNQSRPRSLDGGLDRHPRKVECVEPNSFDALTLDPPNPGPFQRVFGDAYVRAFRPVLRRCPNPCPLGPGPPDGRVASTAPSTPPRITSASSATKNRRCRALRFASAISGSREKGSRGTCAVIALVSLAPLTPSNAAAQASFRNTGPAESPSPRTPIPMHAAARAIGSPASQAGWQRRHAARPRPESTPALSADQRNT